jgi:hypothetical protein
MLDVGLARDLGRLVVGGHGLWLALRAVRGNCLMGTRASQWRRKDLRPGLLEVRSSIDDADLGARRSAQLIGRWVLRGAEQASARRQEHDVKVFSGDPGGERCVLALYEQLQPRAIAN